MSEYDCARLRELAPELALGVLTGEDRAEARNHLANCPDCREFVLELTSVGDSLLALVPGAEPPVGFEDRLLSRLGVIAGQSSAAATAPIPIQQLAAPQPIPAPVAYAQSSAPVDLAHRRARRETRRWVPLAAAAAAIALVFGFSGWAMGLNSQNDQNSHTPAQAAAPLLHGTLVSADHLAMGHVWAWPGKPSWLYMDVEVEQRSGISVTCQVQQADGSMLTVGTFALNNGYGHWGAPAPVGNGEKARLVDSDGTVLASTTLTS
jgi:hypothetical protein